MPKATVIIPNYNHVSYLRERIESVLNQTFQDFEVILLDDASNDGSIEFLKGYLQHPKVSHVVINEHNSGSPFKQWRKGLELAQGEYIWIAESDDYAHERFLETLLEKFESHSNLGLVYCDSYIVNNENKILGQFSDKRNAYFNSNRWSNDYTNKGLDELLTYLFYKTIVNNVSAALIKKSYLDDPHYLNHLVTYRNAGDLYTFLSLSLKTDFGYVAQKLNYYRDHIGNTTKKNMKKGILFEERFKCYTYVVENLRLIYLDENQSKKFRNGIFNVLIRNSFGQIEFNSLKVVLSFLSLLKSIDIISYFKLCKLKIFYTLYSVTWKYNKGFLRRKIKKLLMS